MTDSGPVDPSEQDDGLEERAGVEAEASPEGKARDAIVRAALQRIGRVSLSDILSFLKVADVARGSSLARFYRLFPTDGEERTGRDALVEAIEEKAIAGEIWLEVPRTDAMRLPLLMRDRDEQAFEMLRRLATSDVKAYSKSPGLREEEVLRGLMAVAAHAGDQDAQGHLKRRYARIAPRYADFYKSLLEDALGRKPIPGIETMENLGLVIAALFDGLVLQHSFEHESVETLAAATIVPLLGALTYPKDGPKPSDSDHLYPPEPATASYGLTPPNSLPLPQGALRGLVGTWQGRTYSSRLSAAPTDKGQPDNYLVVNYLGERLEVVQFRRGGTSRAVLPAFLAIGGRHRLTCVYEAERADAQHPSHRGGLVLETSGDEKALSLEGTYFTDTGQQGKLIFDDRHQTAATGYAHAQSLFDESSSSGESPLTR